MTTILDIYNYIDGFAPFDTSMEFDNTGILIGDGKKEVKNVLLALDITGEVIEEAKESGAELIITHHPAIFNGIKSISENDLVYRLIKANIAVISAHTNLDLSQTFGVNTVLAEKLGLENPRFINEELPLVAGELKKPLYASEFESSVSHDLNNKRVRSNAVKINKIIKTVAVGGGACGEYGGIVADMNIDAFVTGELKHHEFLYLTEKNVLAIDAGHFYTENPVIEPLKERLSEKFGDVGFFVSKVCCSY
ncbi:MAG: Nif3-like dinuclear metal center hexameric protein [Clostridiales bacterium]|nr:Nif3-like dinuclear metal center hexameric protein [Clostridiales bacterium]